MPSTDFSYSNDHQINFIVPFFSTIKTEYYKCFNPSHWKLSTERQTPLLREA
jgi:hypothetical protein